MPVDASPDLHRIEQQSGSVDSVERAVALDKERVGLLDQLTGRGVLRNSDALKMKQRDESKETYVRYAGYSLSILGIIIAALAQLRGKST